MSDESSSGEIQMPPHMIALARAAQKGPAIADGGMLRKDDNAPATLDEVLERAAHRDARSGIIYLQPDGSEIYQPYKKLYDNSVHILEGLRALGVQPGERVLLQIEDKEDYLPTFWACILGGFVAVPIPIASEYYQRNTTAQLMRKAWELCDCPLVVANSSLLPPLYRFAAELGLEHFRVATVDTLRRYPLDPSGYNRHRCQPDNVAVIIFTSGSTGMPKGVVRTHENIVAKTRGLIQCLELTDREVTFYWLPLDNGMGLIDCHVRDVYLGCTQVLASPATVLREPLSWINYLDRYRATCSMAPNFAFNLVNEQIEGNLRRQWNLSELKHLLIGGEVIVPKTVRRFLQFLVPYGLPPTAVHPHFGMTETQGIIISTTFSLASSADEDHFVDVGLPVPGITVRIVAERDQLLLEGISGHIQVKGLAVTPGYFRNPDLNDKVFTSDGWFDTGDLGFLNDGRLAITGRAKNIIIINGRTYSCEEIESVVEGVPEVEVGCTAACAVRNAESNTDSLAVFYSTRCSSDAEIWEQLARIRAYMVSTTGASPSYLIPLEKAAIPRTELGKVHRTALKQQFDAGAFDDVLRRFNHKRRARDTEQQASDGGFKTESSVSPELVLSLESRMISIWQDVLEVDTLTTDDNFFALGGDSLLGMRMIAQARRVGINLLPKQLLQYQTIASLVRTATVAAMPTMVKRVEMDIELGPVPLTSSQVWQLAGARDPNHYTNEGYLLEVQRPLNQRVLTQTTQSLIANHDALRLRFAKDGSGWKQFLSPPSDSVPVTWVDTTTLVEPEQQMIIQEWANRLQRSMDLLAGPIMHIAYFDRGPRRSGLLLWIINHLIVDYFSFGILLEDFQTVYEQLAHGEEIRLPPKTTSFKRWAERLNEYVRSLEVERELKQYWLLLPWHSAMPLPVDHPEVKSVSMLVTRTLYESWLSQDETSVLLERVTDTQTSMIDMLLTAIVEVLARWSGRSAIHVCVLDHGRDTILEDIDLSHTVGCISYGRRLFLWWRTTDTPKDALASIREQITACPHDGRNFELLYYLSDHRSQLDMVPPPEIELNYFSRLNAKKYITSLFASLDTNVGPRNGPEEIDNYPPLTVTAEVVADQLRLNWGYNEQMYDRGTIQHIASSCVAILGTLANDFARPWHQQD